MRYFRQLVMMLMISVAVMISIGGSGFRPAAAAEDYKDIFVKAALNESCDPVQRLTVDAVGSFPFENNIYKFLGQGTLDFQQKPFLVGKGMFNASFTTGSFKLEFKVPFCLEQSKIDNIDCLTAYWCFEGKWYKKKVPMPKGDNAR